MKNYYNKTIVFGSASHLTEIPPADKILLAKNKRLFFYQFLIS